MSHSRSALVTRVAGLGSKEVVDELPRNATGKILRRELAEWTAEGSG